MNYVQQIVTGMVYFLEDYTAPKVFNGLYFECLLTEQKIPAHAKIKEEISLIQDYNLSSIYKPQRFNLQ